MTATNSLNQLIKKSTLFVLLLMIALVTFSQTNDSLFTLTKNSQIYSIRKIPSGFVPVNYDIESSYSNDALFEHPAKRGRIVPGDVSKKLLARFRVVNNGDDPDSLYFFPDFSFRNVLLYRLENNKAVPLPVIAPLKSDSASFRLFEVPPHDTTTIIAECYPLRTYTNVFFPHLVRKNYIETFEVKLQLEKRNTSLFTYIFCGLLLMMILFSLATYFQGRNNEFLYYAGYAFFLGLMLFTKPFYFNHSNATAFFFESYLDFILQSTGICFFMAFMMGFLETKRNFPFLHKIYTGGIIFLSAIMVVYTFIHFAGLDYYWQNLVENVIAKNILVGLIVVFLVYAAKNRHHRLLRYLFWGNLLFLLFSLMSLILVLGGSKFIKLPGVFSDSLVLYELGLLIELIFFLMGLAYKNKIQLIEQATERERLKMENERKELEKQVAVMQAHQDERERISADIHDELGSGMTTIRLMSEIAKNKMKENVPVEIDKISNSANEVLNKMNAIIWSMNSSNDTLDSLISYIRAYAIEFFDATPIDCKVTMPATIQSKEIRGDKRRNIFLCVKETLNNVLKHSKASKVNIDIKTDHNLTIVISDNGVGIETEKTRRFGNGLKNIERRMKAIGGAYQIINNGGTETILDLPL